MPRIFESGTVRYVSPGSNEKGKNLREMVNQQFGEDTYAFLPISAIPAANEYMSGPKLQAPNPGVFEGVLREFTGAPAIGSFEGFVYIEAEFISTQALGSEVTSPLVAEVYTSFFEKNPLRWRDSRFDIPETVPTDSVEVKRSFFDPYGSSKFFSYSEKAPTARDIGIFTSGEEPCIVRTRVYVPVGDAVDFFLGFSDAQISRGRELSPAGAKMHICEGGAKKGVKTKKWLSLSESGIAVSKGYFRTVDHLKGAGSPFEIVGLFHDNYDFKGCEGRLETHFRQEKEIAQRSPYASLSLAYASGPGVHRSRSSPDVSLSTLLAEAVESLTDPSERKKYFGKLKVLGQELSKVRASRRSPSSTETELEFAEAAIANLEEAVSTCQVVEIRDSWRVVLDEIIEEKETARELQIQGKHFKALRNSPYNWDADCADPELMPSETLCNALESLPNLHRLPGGPSDSMNKFVNILRDLYHDKLIFRDVTDVRAKDNDSHFDNWKDKVRYEDSLKAKRPAEARSLAIAKIRASLDSIDDKDSAAQIKQQWESVLAELETDPDQ